VRGLAAAGSRKDPGYNQISVSRAAQGPGTGICAACSSNGIFAEVIMSDFKSLVAVTRRALLAGAAAIAIVMPAGSGALAADPSKADAPTRKSMNMDEPMAGGMKKEGMKKGDVKKAAEKKDREMRKMLEKEQQPTGSPKK
jgi:hypothetical protein